ncbi:NADH dehydrogenase [ubiquinone] 1 beta subcomplex subunit 11, mitochondrial-like [Ptychodera flava]|uniref:NADH dehydrogenase [ubiquinone] 1 beta subcomplex subunit 11, mitochondrial-like n=1 Tax=Ptychodera flava TaxID=63121 RepID=UPI00396A3718
MASLCRVTRLLVPQISRNARHLRPVVYQPVVFSSTSETKKSEFVVGKATEIDPARVEEIIKQGEREPTDDVNDPNWVSHGWSETDPALDTMTNRVTFFFTVSIVLVFGTLFMHYMPDTTGRLWAEKEAHIVLAEREAAGLPLIDPNYIDPSNIILPAEDEELE